VPTVLNFVWYYVVFLDIVYTKFIITVVMKVIKEKYARNRSIDEMFSILTET